MGVSVYDVVQANAFIGSQFLTQGKTFFVKPRTGSDGADGKSPRRAFKTLAQALSKCTAGQNDVVYLMAESNTAGSTTDYQSATLDWNKDLVHLIGVNAGPVFSQRSRVANLSTAAVPTPLFTLSANGCLIQGIEFFHGQGSANPSAASICMQVSGQRNVIRGCHIAGIGHTELGDAGSCSLKIDAGAENLFDNCVIGQDTSTLGAAVNAVMYFATGATRNMFRKCKFMLYTNHATNSVFLRAAAGSMDRYQIFEDCVFLNAIDSGSTAIDYAFVVAAGGSPAGGVLLIGNSAIQGATDWNSADSGNVTALNGSITSATYGLGVDVTRS